MGIDYFVFGDVDSRAYDIEVFFKDIDHTPKRVYEMREVPGRNGTIYIDQKRYEDVSVVYDCIALDDTDRKAFVNALASQIGHKRLQDSFNEDEFYDAIFDGDVDPNVTSDRGQSTFSVYFTRKPQRYLVSGESPVEVESGDTILNPTRFDSSPMFEVEGYGTIAFNGYEIEIENAVMGNVILASPKTYSSSFNIYFNKEQFNNGDVLTLNGVSIDWYQQTSGAILSSVSSIVHSNEDFSTSYTGTASALNTAITTVQPISFAAGTDSTVTDLMKLIGVRNGATVELYVRTEISYEYDWSSSSSAIKFRIMRSNLTTDPIYFHARSISHSGAVGESTLSILGHPTYIDCDLGEVYMIKDGTPVSLNRYIDLGSELPKLASGGNVIIYDNTITDLKVIPRWWKL